MRARAYTALPLILVSRLRRLDEWTALREMGRQKLEPHMAPTALWHSRLTGDHTERPVPQDRRR